MLGAAVAAATPTQPQQSKKFTAFFSSGFTATPSKRDTTSAIWTAASGMSAARAMAHRKAPPMELFATKGTSG